jgi:pimeloyl-ACP methyl ester carboxylesterase
MRQLGGALGGVMAAMMGGALVGRTLTGAFLAENLGDPSVLDAAAVEGFWWPLHEGATVPMRAVARRFDAIVAEFPRYSAALRKFHGPAMLVWGAKDRVLPFEKSSPRFAADLRLAPDRVRAVPGAAHFVPIDHPDVVSAAVEELLASPLSAAD